MIELSDTAPAIAVEPAEYTRLLGYPRRRVLEGRAAELAEAAAAWYAAHGRPWLHARPAERLELGGDDVVTIDGSSFHSRRLHGRLRQAEASGVVLVAVSAGPELEQEAARLWRAERPDEYYFFETYGSAVVEHLVTAAGARLCAWADGEGAAVLPHYSPGYPEWDIAEQRLLLEAARGGRELPGPLEALDSGALRPKKSLLAAFGITRHVGLVERLTELVPCASCSLAGCRFRRVPYRRAAECQTNPQPRTS